MDEIDIPKFGTHSNIVTKSDSNRVAQMKVCNKFHVGKFLLPFHTTYKFQMNLFTLLKATPDRPLTGAQIALSPLFPFPFLLASCPKVLIYSL